MLNPLIPQSLILAPQPFQFPLVWFTLSRLFLLSFLLPHHVVTGPPIKAPAAAWPTVLPMMAPAPHPPLRR
jgi:hypothetical protein